MDKEKFEIVRARRRLKDLNYVLREISSCKAIRLNYVDECKKGCTEWIMSSIRDLLDMHDEMIRSEIQREIDNLHAKIETL